MFGVVPGVALHNLYGPTEASVDVTAYRCVPGERLDGLDRCVRWGTRGFTCWTSTCGRLPVGVAGELYLAGMPAGARVSGVGRG